MKEMMMWRGDACSEQQKEQVVRAVVSMTRIEIVHYSTIYILDEFW